MDLISVVIPVYYRHNNIQQLGRCLASLQGQSYPMEKIEVVIVGDGCIPHEELIPRDMQVKTYVFSKRTSLAKLRNKGISLSSGALVAFVDADGRADSNWLLKLSQGFKRMEIGGCGGRVDCLEDKRKSSEWIYATKYSLPFAGTCNSIFRRKVLDEMGGFDENFLCFGEDVDLCWRICLKGY